MTIGSGEDSLIEIKAKEKASVKRKVFVIDTNVLLHDPDAIRKFHGNDVVIPLAVLEELDGLKRQSDELGKNARHVMRYIDSIKNIPSNNIYHGVEIENGVVLRIYLENKQVDKKNFSLPLDRTTNKILLNAFLLKEQGEQVVFVSKDFVTRVKAEAIGLEAENYENLKFSYDQIYKGYRKIEVPKKDIDLFYKDGFLDVAGKDFSPNEYAVLTCPEMSSAVCKYNPVRKG
ncbi:MAG: PIN domain-containing protein [Rhabdochlamydiaceae bacterium]|jgi:PhoH-like ATPase